MFGIYLLCINLLDYWRINTYYCADTGLSQT